MKKILLFSLLLFLIAGCSQEQVNVVETEQNDISEEEILDSDSNIREITIDSFSFGYSETQIKAKLGETIRLTLTNSKGNHDFVIDELDVRTKIIKTGESTTIEFTPDKVGTFSFYCSVGSHRAAGMEGLFIVE